MKKTISLAAAVIMLLTSIFSNTVFAAFSDVNDENQYSKAITTLSMLNIINGYDDGTFKPEGSITRAEFTAIIVRALGLEDLQTEPKEFSDVSDHWAKYYIKTAYDQGIINGFEDATFRPDENVTYEQALKMVVCTLGYTSYAEAEGGYPSGYISQGNSLGLTKSVTGLAYDDPAPRGAIAQIVYNALEIDMKQLDGTGTSWVSSGKNLLNDYLNVRKFKGEMAGVEEYVTGNCHGTLLKGQMQMVDLSDTSQYITMDYTEYTSDVTDISKYLGKLITVYYRQKNTNDDAFLVVIDDETTKNTEYTVTSSDLISFDSSSIKYYENNSNVSKTVRFNLNDVTVRYNGKSVDKNAGTKLRNKNYTSADNEFTDVYTFEDALKAWLTPDSDHFIYGDVVLIDRESDGTVDDIQINDYQTIVALKSPSTSDYKITDKLKVGNSLILNPDSTQYTYTIVKDGKQIAVTSIAANDILLYAESIDKSLYTVYAMNEKLTGTITSIDPNGKTIDVDNVTYNLGDQCENYINTKQDGTQLANGQTVTFYLDKYNTLVYGEVAEEKEKPYAYITSVYQEDGTDIYYISAYCPSRSTSGVINYPLKDKVSIDGQSMSAAQAVAALAESAQNSNQDILIEENRKAIYGTSAANKYDPEASGNETKYMYSQLARIDVNSSGYVSSIVTLSPESQDTNESSSKIVRCKDLYVSGNNHGYSYTSNSFTLNNQTQFSINSSTLIIYVPGDRSRTGFAKKTASSTFSSTEKYDVEAYDINSSKYAGVVLLYGTSGSKTEVSKTTDYSIIAEKPSSYYDENMDATTQRISVYTGASNAIKEWTTADSEEFSTSEVGDVILFGFDQDNYAEGKVNCISFSDIAEVLDGKTVTVGDHNEIYNWAETQTPSAANNWQTYKFDFKYKVLDSNNEGTYDPSTGEYEDEIYSSSTLGRVPYSRATMYNVMQVLDDASKIYVTKGGFTEDGVLADENNYEEITISSSTKIVRMEEDRDSISPYAEDSQTDMSYLDLKDAKNYGQDCSKILVTSLRGVARLIVVYE